MTASLIDGVVKYVKSGKYRIAVQGTLNESWSNGLAGMQIVPDDTGQDTKITTMIGYLKDQAQLSDVLNTLYELHLPILLVEYIADVNDDRDNVRRQEKTDSSKQDSIDISEGT